MTNLRRGVSRGVHNIAFTLFLYMVIPVCMKEVQKTVRTRIVTYDAVISTTRLDRHLLIQPMLLLRRSKRLPDQ